jgi:Uma2 family endonuclease
MTLSLEKLNPPSALLQRHDATWQDYVTVRDRLGLDWRKISFYNNWLWVDMGKEGPGHARFSDLMTIIFGFWAFLHPDVAIESFGRCLIEKAETQACAPDLVLYRGENIPHWQPGEPRRIDLARHRLPDLVGEIGDTTLSLDLDEQKQLYASLGVPEYWVIDVKGMRLFAFGLNANGIYQAIETSQALKGLSIALLEQTLERLASETNTAAANWLMKQLQSDSQSSDLSAAEG